MSDPPFCTEADAAKTSGARLEKCFALIVRLCLNRFNVVSREEFNAHGEILTNAAVKLNTLEEKISVLEESRPSK
ncbi:MAG: hypothetical protein R1F54_03820 [Candidatus Zeuxoniibacter abyssi]|nr:MAG: hypothetical protein R1F54_03820 [Candidatus Persebacteraceae bacterium AB1(2)]